jgi:hypothetical protein
LQPHTACDIGKSETAFSNRLELDAKGCGALFERVTPAQATKAAEVPVRRNPLAP